jgi:hypothetical protein
LGLEHEPELAARLLEVAQAARDERDTEARMPDPEPAAAVPLADQKPSTVRHELNARASPPTGREEGQGLEAPAPDRPEQRPEARRGPAVG